MALKAILDSLDGVAAQVAEHYVERDGKYHLDAEGFRTQADVDRLQGALNKEREDHKAVKAKYQPLSALGLDVEVVVERASKYPELELLSKGKLDETKVEEIVKGRVQSAIMPLNAEINTLKAGIGERDSIIGTYKERDRIAKIHGEIRKAAEKSNVLPSAIEDALISGERVFDIDETGRVVTKDNVGVTPGVDPAVWLTEIQPRRQHWWPASQGGGSRGGGGGGGGARNPFAADSWNMTEQGQIVRENPQRAADLARAAGTTVGGPRPTK